jgi:hypothetical protein
MGDRHYYREALELGALLQRVRFTACKDPRDKVFAVLGIAQDVLPGNFSMDYQEDVIDVFIGVVRWHLKTHDDLQILRYARWAAQGDKVQHPDFPSWVPDRRQAAKGKDFTLRPFGKRRSKRFYSASGDERRQDVIVGRRLRVVGFVIDAMATLSEIWDENELELCDVVTK